MTRLTISLHAVLIAVLAVVLAVPAGTALADTVPLNMTRIASIGYDADTYPGLDDPLDVAITQIDSKIYAVVTSTGYDGIQIIDITVPADPKPAGSVKKSGSNMFAIAITEINSRTYAVVTVENTRSVQIIDITNPSNPSLGATMVGKDGLGSGTYERLSRPYDVAVAKIGTDTYAVATSWLSDGVEIINITDPANPSSASSIADGSTYMLNNPVGVAVAEIGSKTYALVTAAGDTRVQIIDISDPSSPSAASNLELNKDETDFRFPMDIATAQIGSKTYAVVAERSGNGVRIIDITDPSDPSKLSLIENGYTYPNLIKPEQVAIANVGSDIYAVVTTETGTVQIINITDPADPSPGPVIAGHISVTQRDTPYGVAITQIGSKTYAVTTAYERDRVDIIELVPRHHTGRTGPCAPQRGLRGAHPRIRQAHRV